MASVPEIGQNCELHVHTYAREDRLSLFGFATAAEKRLFRLLISVPRVGPANAIAVLGGFPVAELVECIVSGDHGKLTRIPGIGRKTADQIVLTLADKLGGEDGFATAGATEGVSAGADSEAVGSARAVLVSLGWKPKLVDKALGELELAPDSTLDVIVRATLAKLMER